ncbi:MAG: F0F1 ATP synthase subunit epsilon [Deltaproteobacteria bacterium]|nr:F0F1 ATP synthase subunit epsilon [Deltaproteobacteria bacterium]MBW2106322.1 F0F1 ATP synthase subunit epsilon [Deltaproteobacteria bacterium]MCD6265994.1 F0F1 ATP synthase subunit epsilon [Deltaproteobacteria bacterium]RLB24625.1 MAG: F0F1 ATP synthase subunit epsilon [Deltaproteobacteria bacterium]
MATFRLELVTAERMVYSDDVDMVIAWGLEGQLGILPHHAPLMTMLQPGELIVKKDNKETYMAVSGGFLEVRPDKVIVLADACERAEEIDRTRAEEAKRQAEEIIRAPSPETETATAEAALRRSLVRLKVAEKIRRKRGQKPRSL